MQNQKTEIVIRKNLLDLKYNKYLQYLNTAIIMLFTYFIGLTIAFITKQIDYKNINQLWLVMLLSIAITSTFIILMSKFKRSLTTITRDIEMLNINPS